MLKFFFPKKQSGIALLPTVLIAGVIISEIGAAFALIVYFSNLAGYNAKIGQEALFAAQSGINDAVLRVVRDRNFPSGYSVYQLTVGRANVSVSVEKNQPATGQDRVIAEASVLNWRKKVQAVLSVDANTGQVSIVSFSEI